MQAGDTPEDLEHFDHNEIRELSRFDVTKSDQDRSLEDRSKRFVLDLSREVRLPLSSAEQPALSAPEQQRAVADSQRMRAVVEENLDFIWRMARRFGLSPNDADDVVQEVFLIAARKLADIQPGKERSYLFSVAVHLTRRTQRAAARRTELLEDWEAPRAGQPDEQLDHARARQLLDTALSSLPEDLKTVFVLHELESFTMAAIANLLDLRAGTVASRLRRAREEFKRRTQRLRKKGVP